MSDSATPWTIAYQAALSMEFSRQEYWSGLPFPFSRGSSQPRDRNPGLPHYRQTTYSLSHQGNSPFFACSVKIAVGSLNIFPLPAGTMLPFASRGRRWTGSASWSRCAGATERTSQVWLLRHTWPPQAPASAELKAPLLLCARDPAVSSTRGSSEPPSPPTSLNSFVAQSFPGNTFPWHPLGQTSKEYDQHQPPGQLLSHQACWGPALSTRCGFQPHRWR